SRSARRARAPRAGPGPVDSGRSRCPCRAGAGPALERSFSARAIVRSWRLYSTYDDITITTHTLRRLNAAIPLVNVGDMFAFQTSYVLQISPRQETHPMNTALFDLSGRT